LTALWLIEGYAFLANLPHLGNGGVSNMYPCDLALIRCEEPLSLAVRDTLADKETQTK